MEAPSTLTSLLLRDWKSDSKEGAPFISVCPQDLEAPVHSKSQVPQNKWLEMNREIIMFP